MGWDQCVVRYIPPGPELWAVQGENRFAIGSDPGLTRQRLIEEGLYQELERRKEAGKEAFSRLIRKVLQRTQIRGNTFT